MIKSISLSDLEIDYILELPEVTDAKVRIDSQNEGSIYFSIPLTNSLRETLHEKFDLDFSLIDSIPMRWIKGDTKPHIDRSVQSFDKTYLAYLTDSQGEFIIDGESYPITRGSGYVFSEGLSHETLGTGYEPRLLLGPMSESGISVGGPYQLSYQGGTTVYIRENSGFFELSLDQNSWNNFYFPVDVLNSNTTSGSLIIEFTTDITFTNFFEYFTCKTSHIQFGSSSLKPDGTKTNINISGVGSPGYPGLIQNGDNIGNNGYGNIYVYNLNVISSGSTLAGGAGWIGQAYFAKNINEDIYIINCSSNGDITYDNGFTLGGGGIVGGSSANGGSATLYIIGCSSSGLINEECGGIVGSYSCNNGNIICNNCWSEGAIRRYAGGIFGKYGPYAGGTAVARFCYSTGLIGQDVGSDLGFGAGGIFGGDVPLNDSNSVATAENCYSLGNIRNTSGGIFGSGAGNFGTVSVINCYSAGTYNNLQGIYGAFKASVIEINCYAANGSWNSTAANSSLQGTPNPVVGTIWVATIQTQPYELNNMGYTPYTITNITTTSPPSLVQTYSTSVNAGNSSSSAIVAGLNYSILQISPSNSTIAINSNTGAISTTSSTAPGTYTLYIRNTGSYNITTLTLTVSEIPIPPVPPPIPNVPICFPAGTPVLTDQGEIAIEKIDTSKHTIRGKEIVAITKSIPTDSHLVCIEKHSLGNNKPIRRTIITKHHKVFYQGRMVTAEYLSHFVPNVHKILYNKEPVYNVLLKEHSTMMINNILVETMYPQHILARIYSGNYTPEQRNFLITKLNKYNLQKIQSVNMRGNIFRR